MTQTFSMTFVSEEDAFRYLLDHNWRYIPPWGWKKGTKDAKIVIEQGVTSPTVQIVFID